MNKIEWIFFDVGGVILDDTSYEKTRIDNLHHTIHIFDSRVTRQQVQDSLPRASSMVGQLNDNILSSFISDPQKLQMAKNLMAGKRQRMYENRGTVRPEAKEVLMTLSKKYKIGLIANQPTSTRQLLIEAGIDDHIMHFKVSSDHGLSKPDVRYFLTVLEENSATPEESVMVDDNIERGILPAKKIGMTTVWFKTMDRNDIPENQIDFTIEKLDELSKIFV